MTHDTDTIVAQATPAGRGGVSIVRVSGPLAQQLGEQLCGQSLTPRYAHFCEFRHREETLDHGIGLFFRAPHSFTGEDVVEFQGHGGPVLVDRLCKALLELGCRMARPGEFSERAFLNDKIDLAQAEAIADLIDSVSETAARNALRSLEGEFSRRINSLVESLIQLRIYVEAAIDFPEEEIDFLSDGKVETDLNKIQDELQSVLAQARQGALIKEGMTVVIAGKPNAGKSSLLNALSGRDSAIVTAIEGTTRDVLREHIQIDGMPLHIIDTAGLRDSPDTVEQEGIRRAWTEIESADRVLLVHDSSKGTDVDMDDLWPEYRCRIGHYKHLSLILNKCDLSQQEPGICKNGELTTVALSAKSGLGMEGLREHLKQCMGYDGATEGGFTARRRHVQALEQAQHFIDAGFEQLLGMGAGELLAEDLRMAQNCLSEITGRFSSDALLGRIFSSFCIGK